MTRDTMQTPPKLSSTTAMPALSGFAGVARPGRNAAVLPVTVSTGDDEMFGDWQVAYVGRDGRKVHVARFQSSGPLISRVAIDLGFAADGTMLGALMLPLGLKRNAGVRLQVDHGVLLAKVGFVSAGPMGDIVKLGFGLELVEALQQAETLHVYAEMASNRKKLVFAIPLTGFGNAIHRLLDIERVRPV